MKKYLIISIALMVVLSVSMLSGCGKSEPEEQSDGVANPWTDVKSAEEAGKGAGFDSFEIGIDKVKIEPSEGLMLDDAKYRYTDGLAEAVIPIAAIEMTIRKGTDASADVGEGDISGDYNEYKNKWEQDADGIKATCFGNRKGESTKTIWQNGDYLYSITAYGQGGDTDYGLQKEDVAKLVTAIK